MAALLLSGLTLLSPSAWREWIEINFTVIIKSILYVSLHSGERIEIPMSFRILLLSESPSTRREWIEMRQTAKGETHVQSLSTRREWIEIIVQRMLQRVQRSSLSTRREWIEIDNR